MEMMRSELQYLDKVLSPIADEREKLKVELRSTPRITVFQQAEPPKTPDGRAHLRNTAMAGLGGFFGCDLPGLVVGCGQAADQFAGRPLAGARADRGGHRSPPVAENGPRGWWRQESATNGRSPWIMRWIRSPPGCSCEKSGAEGVRVVMVSSATPGEGKTTLAVQLATRLARTGKRTLLVDYDLRRPSIHRIFGMPRGPGVSECLQKECDLGQVVHRTDAENLSVITAGDLLLDLLGPLANGATTSFFEQARAAFTFVVVDGCPILPVIDGLLVSQHADTVVLSVRRDTSQAPQVLRACEKLSAFGSRKHVVVLNGSQEEVGGDYQDAASKPAVEAVETAEAAETKAEAAKTGKA